MDLESTQVSSFLGSGALSATAAFSTFPMTQPPHETLIDNQASSSLFQPSDSGSPATSATSSTSTSTNSDVVRQLAPAGPLTAGILVFLIVIAAVVVICFVKRRRKRRRKRCRSFKALFSLQSDSEHPHRHSRNRFLCDEILTENDPPKGKYHRYSRYSRRSSGTMAMELDARHAEPQISVTEDGSAPMTHEGSLPSAYRDLHPGRLDSTILNTIKMGVNKSNHKVVDGRQTSASSSALIASDLGTVSSNQVEQYSTRELTSSPSQNNILHPLQRPNNSSLPPSVDRQRLNDLIQQRAALLASENTSDKSVYNELLLLEEQIQILRCRDISLPHQDIPDRKSVV